MSLAYTSDPLKLELIFSTFFPSFYQNLNLLSSISISNLLQTDFNYSFSNSSLQTSFFLFLSSTKAIVNGPILNYTLDLSDYFLLENNLYMPSKSSTIRLFDYYPMSESTKKLADSLKSQIGTSQTIAQSSGYASTFLSSGCSLFVQGLLLVEMIFCLKYIDVNYPFVVRQIFESKSSNPTLLFHFNFINDPKDAEVISSLFQHYNVSVYFLNNVGEAICQIFAIILIATCFLMITPYEINQKKKIGIFMKIVIFIRDALAWETSLFYILMNLQKIIFYITCSWVFPPLNSFNALLNLSIATFFGFIIILWLLHLMIKIKVCQNFKEEMTLLNDKIYDSSLSFMSPKEKNDELSFVLTPSSTPPTTKIKIFKKNDLDLDVNNTFVDIQPKTNQNIFEKSEGGKEKKSNSINIMKKWFTPLQKFFFNPKIKTVFLRRYEVLHLEYKSARAIHRYYAFLFYMRQCFISVLVVVLHNSPLFAAIAINMINLFFLFFTIISRPFTTNYSFIVSLVNESITEAALFSGMILAIYDQIDEVDSKKRMDLGWVIVLANTILLYWVIATGIMKPIYYALFDFCKKRRALAKVHKDSK